MHKKCFSERAWQPGGACGLQHAVCRFSIASHVGGLSLRLYCILQYKVDVYRFYAARLSLLYRFSWMSGMAEHGLGTYRVSIATHVGSVASLVLYFTI